LQGRSTPFLAALQTRTKAQSTHFNSSLSLRFIEKNMQRNYLPLSTKKASFSW
jgi:hypothetical protein